MTAATQSQAIQPSTTEDPGLTDDVIRAYFDARINLFESMRAAYYKRRIDVADIDCALGELKRARRILHLGDDGLLSGLSVSHRVACWENQMEAKYADDGRRFPNVNR